MVANPSTKRTFYYLLLLAILLACALAPTNRLTSAFSHLTGPLKAVLAPVSGVASFVSTRIRPPVARVGPDDVVDDERYAELERQWLAAMRENQLLKRQIAALEQRAPYGPEPEHRRLSAQRIGADVGAGTIDVRAGEREGVTVGAVASAVRNPLQLVGAVTRTHNLISTVHIITHPRFSYAGLEFMQGVIVPPEGVTDEAQLAERPRCQLRPAGSGRLVAPLVGVDTADEIGVGDEVLLDDEAWPAGAQMLTIGRIVRIEETEEPLYKRVVVRPTLDLSRVGRVVLRIPPEAPGAREGGS